MAKLNASDIENYAKLAGFSGKDADIATAVALAESGGDTNSHNTQGKDDSYGLWQINMKGALGPDRRKRYHIGKNEDLFNPSENARVAYAIYKDNNGFSPWTTYTSGKYKDFMGKTEGTDTVPGDATPADLNPVQGVGSALNAVGLNIFRSLSNVVGVIVAAVLIIAAVVIFAMQSRIGKKAVKTVTSKVI